MSRVFILGSTGIIGYNVAKQFAQRGWTVYGLVRSAEKFKLLEEIEVIPVIGQVSETKNWESIAASCDVIIEAMADYQDHNSSNISKNTLLAIKKQHPAISIIYTSGVWVYGSRPEQVDENTPLNPITMVKGRPAVEAEYTQAGAVVVRPGCVYGKSGSLFGDWFKRVREGNVSFAGDGEQSWATVHVDDLADAYIKIAESGNNFHGHIFNLVSRSIRVADGFKAIGRIVGDKGEVKWVGGTDPFSEALSLNQFVSSQKAQILLKWNPVQKSFTEGVEKYYISWKASNNIK